MNKILKPTKENQCIGCELCILEIQRQARKHGLEGSLIRVLKKRDEETETIKYSIQIDPSVNNYNLEKIAAICPKHVFEVEAVKEMEDTYELTK